MVKMSFNCPENSDEMPKVADGRFCGSCQKGIVDYTALSKVEILEKLKSVGKNTCGIFKKHQIVNSNRIEITSRFRMAFMMVFLLGMNTSELLAQDTTTVNPLTILTPHAADTSYIIKGQVIDVDSIVVPLAIVWVELDSIDSAPNRIYARTDFDGNFRLSLPNTIETPINLFARSVGFDTSSVQGITFTPFKRVVEVDVTLTEMELNWIGVINICPPLIQKDPYEIGKTRLDGDDIRQWD